MTVARKLVTVEEYARMPDREGFRDELIEGEVIYRPLAGMLHGWCCVNAGSPLVEYAHHNGGVTTSGSGVVVGRNPDSVLAPDVAHWRQRPSKLDDWPEAPPAVVIEVVDHDEPYHHTLRKVLLYRRFGVGVVWVVAPLCEVVTEYRAGAARLLDVSDSLDGGDVLPGFSCKVADLFT